MAKKKKEKKELSEFDLTRPEQLLLFELEEKEQALSNTVVFYDSIPKYVWGRPARENGKFLNTVVREFEIEGMRDQVQISPARVEGKDGTFRDHFPGVKEELVEDALRKLVAEGQGMFLDGEVGVCLLYTSPSPRD